MSDYERALAAEAERNELRAEVVRLRTAVEMLTGALNVADLTVSRHDDGPAMNARSVIRHAIKHAGHVP